MLLVIVARILVYGFVCAYRLAYATIADAVLLIALTGAALGAGYLFG